MGQAYRPPRHRGLREASAQRVVQLNSLVFASCSTIAVSRAGRSPASPSPSRCWPVRCSSDASVRASLRDLALARLGATELVVSSTAILSGSARRRLAPQFRSHGGAVVASTPMLALTGAVTTRAADVPQHECSVFGIDERFLAFHGRSGAAPTDRQAWMSPGLAAELGAEADDDATPSGRQAYRHPAQQSPGPPRRSQRTDSPHRDPHRLRVTELGEFSLVLRKDQCSRSSSRCPDCSRISISSRPSMPCSCA